MAKRILFLILVPSVLATFVPSVHAAQSGDSSDLVLRVLLALLALLAAAKLGGELFERLKLPAVLGELVAGMVLGNLVLIRPQWSFFEPLRVVPIEVHWAVAISVLAQLGVIILLFAVGLESTVGDMMRVGASSFLVAVLGVIAPMLLGCGVSWIFIRQIPRQLQAVVPPGFSLMYVHLFVGSVLCATSVGITARVFSDLGTLQQKEARIVLGAAVIDDVLGLIVLAVVSGLVTAAERGQALAIGSILRLVMVATLFLGAALLIGTVIVPRVLRRLSRLRTSGVMLVSALLFSFLMSYLAGVAGLAPIVGAFAAGLLLEEAHFQGFREEVHIRQLINPVATFLVPIFFVLMGIQVHLETFANPPVLGIAAGLTVAAVAGKQICGLGVLERGLDRVSVGVGMIPRGEVGLIMAGIGRDLNVVDDATFSAIVIMVVATTLITPPLLKLTLGRTKRSGVKALRRDAREAE